MSAPGLLSKFRTLTTEFKALAAGHWTLFRQEIAGKATHTRQQSIWIVAGGLTAFTALLLLHQQRQDNQRKILAHNAALGRRAVHHLGQGTQGGTMRISVSVSAK